MRYYLALDMGVAKRKDNSDRYKILDLTKINDKDGFNTLPDAIDFTGKYKNYSELFLKLCQSGILTDKDLGLPFTFVHKIKDNTLWVHCGTKKYPCNNKVLFKDQLSIMEYPNKEQLKKEYDLRSDDQYKDLDERHTIEINLTRRILKCSLPMFNGAFNHELATQRDNLYHLFLQALHDLVQEKVNGMRRMGLYETNMGFQGHVELLDSYNLTLYQYINEQEVKSSDNIYNKYFAIPIKNIVHMLVFSSTQKKTKNDEESINTYKINYQTLFELATFCVDFFDYHMGRFNRELITLKEELCKRYNKEEEIVQYDMFGTGYTQKDLEELEKRKKGLKRRLKKSDL